MLRLDYNTWNLYKFPTESLPIHIYLIVVVAFFVIYSTIHSTTDRRWMQTRQTSSPPRRVASDDLSSFVLCHFFDTDRVS